MANNLTFTATDIERMLNLLIHRAPNNEARRWLKEELKEFLTDYNKVKTHIQHDLDIDDEFGYTGC